MRCSRKSVAAAWLLQGRDAAGRRILPRARWRAALPNCRQQPNLREPTPAADRQTCRHLIRRTPEEPSHRAQRGDQIATTALGQILAVGYPIDDGLQCDGGRRTRIDPGTGRATLLDPAPPLIRARLVAHRLEFLPARWSPSRSRSRWPAHRTKPGRRTDRDRTADLSNPPCAVMACIGMTTRDKR